MPTALELTREEWQSYIEAARQHPSPPELSETDQQIHEQLMERVQKAAALLKSKLGVKRVTLFGSLVDPTWFTPDSDIDIAVEGLDADSYWQAWQLIEEIISTHSVDLIELETAKASLRKAIDRYGLEL